MEEAGGEARQGRRDARLRRNQRAKHGRGGRGKKGERAGWLNRKRRVCGLLKRNTSRSHSVSHYPQYARMHEPFDCLTSYTRRHLLSRRHQPSTQPRDTRVHALASLPDASANAQPPSTAPTTGVATNEAAPAKAAEPAPARACVGDWRNIMLGRLRRRCIAASQFGNALPSRAQGRLLRAQRR